MSSTAHAGLSRRRRAAPSNDTPNSTSETLESSAQNDTGDAYDESEKTGSRVHCDPRDVVDRSDAPPFLTLMEEVLLVGIKDRQGHLSFWNDSVSYVLRGCILLELALRRRISILPDPSRRRLPLAERMIRVISEKPTGEILLDEALRMIKATPESISIGDWIDYMSGETWNLMRIGFQLKQVRERLAKGLVDKGVLRTEKKSFLLFEMATHPVSDSTAKQHLLSRLTGILCSRTAAVDKDAGLGMENVRYPLLRTICLICATNAGAVLENALGRLTFEGKVAAFNRADEIMTLFSTWPFGTDADQQTGQMKSSSSSQNLTNRPTPAKADMSGIGEGRRRRTEGLGSLSPLAQSQNAELLRLVAAEIGTEGTGLEEGCAEIVAAVLSILLSMDAL